MGFYYVKIVDVVGVMLFFEDVFFMVHRFIVPSYAFHTFCPRVGSISNQSQKMRTKVVAHRGLHPWCVFFFSIGKRGPP